MFHLPSEMASFGSQLVISVPYIFIAGDQISFEDFLAFKSLQHNVAEDDHDRLRLEFQLVDTDSNGMIDWWEFLNYQSKMKLFSRSQVHYISSYQ